MIISSPYLLTVAGDIVGDALRRLGNTGFANKNAGHLVVLDFTNGFRPLPKGMTIEQIVKNDDLFNKHFAGLILIDRQYNEDGNWKPNYQHIARAKAILSGRERNPTSMVIDQHSLNLQPGDVAYPGGVWIFGLAAGFSGVEGENDEALAWIAVSPIQANTQILADKTPKSGFYSK